MNSQSEQGRGYHSILIVEDDRAVRESLKFSLVIEGFAVRAYADAEHLLAEPRLPKFDCLIVDQNMPGMNGLDLVSRTSWRKQPRPVRARQHTINCILFVKRNVRFNKIKMV